MTEVKMTSGAQGRCMPDEVNPEAAQIGGVIKEWREDKRYSRPAMQRALSKRAIKTTADYLAKLELGYRDFRNAGLELREGIREILEISPREWREKTGLFVPLAPGEVVPGGTIEQLSDDVLTGTHKVPLYDLISAGPGGEGGTIIEYLDVPDAWKGQYVGYLVHGDSMSPQIPDRSKIIVKVQDHSDINDIIACYTPDNGNVVKVLRHVAEDGTVTLTSLNPSYPPIWAPYIHVFGVVVEIRTAPPVIDRNGNGRHPRTN